MRKIAAVLATAALLFGATACSGYNDHRGRGDAPVENRKGDDSPAKVANMPDTFPNIATKCLKGHEPWAAAVTTDRILILFQDPDHCGGKVVTGSLTAEGN